MCFQSEKPGNAHLVPVKQEAIYQSPYYFFVFKLFILFNSFKFLYPFLAQFLFDLDFLLFIEVIVASVIGWDDTRLLDVTKKFNETIPRNSTCCCVPILDIVEGMDRHELLRLGEKRYKMDVVCICCIRTGAKSWLDMRLRQEIVIVWNNIRLGG